MKNWIILSPHLDDAVYSCGGWIRDRVETGGTVEIWTIFAGDPPAGPLSGYAGSLHARWKLGREAAARRREEDRQACEIVGAGCLRFNRPDCIYRRDPETGGWIYQSDAQVFGEPNPAEADWLVEVLADEWERMLPAQRRVVSPLGLGGHVDHRIVRLAAERLEGDPGYYADLPYVFTHAGQIPGLLPAGAQAGVYPVSERGLKSWIAGIMSYGSQFSTFWDSAAEMESQLRGYLQAAGGLKLWNMDG